MALIKERKAGDIHYLTYRLIFPKDKDEWIDQITLVHPLQWELKRMSFIKGRPGLERDLLIKGECSFKDHNGVRHVVKIEQTKRPRHWGKTQGLAQS